MRTKIFTLLFGALFASASVMAVNVTFRVDMANVTEAFTTPEVNGDFNSWCGGCAPMTNIGADVWELVIDLAPGNYEFKYAVDAWSIQEPLQQGTSCTTTNFGFTNRVVDVANEPIDLGTVCWGSCLACGVAAPMQTVTFRVDMSDVTEAFTTPEVNGTFNGWCGNCAPMTNIGGDVWELQITLPAGSYEFKYSANNWAIQEQLTAGSPCTVTSGTFTNRTLVVTDQNIDLGTVCWGSCTGCGVVAPNYDVTFRVDMSDVPGGFSTPEVNGSFNEWCGNCAPMTNVGGDVWELTIALPSGSYEYKFSADNFSTQEELTPGSACTVTNFGFTNRTLAVSNQNIDLGTVCWASCEACEGGNNGGGGECTLDTVLSFDDPSSLNGWQAIADATNPAEAQFGFSVAGGTTTGALLLAGTNQSSAIGKAFIFEYIDANFDYQNATSVELSFDVKLATPLVGAAFHLQTQFPGVGVTNTFDLQAAGLSETDWANFSYTFNGIGDGNLFRIHFNIAAGAFVGAGGQILIDNISLVCAGGAGAVGCTDQDAVNYDADAEIDNGSCLYNVTFRVDMADVAETFTTPEVNGTFNDFCGGCAPMTNIGGDLWELVIPLPSGNYEFKYAADTWAIEEALVPGSACTVTNFGFTNRFFQVNNQPLELETVCWGSCNACGFQPQVYDVTFRVDMSEVTETFTTPEVSGDFNGWCGGCAPMTNIGGDVWELVIALEPGNYEFKYNADAWTIDESLTPGASCTVTNGGFTNRSLTVVNQNIDLGTVCWGSCVACDVTVPVYNVTFRVDMAQVTDEFTTPEVNGTFNDFCGNCAPMTEVSANIWELTIALEQGSYEYKFSADNWTIQEELTSGSSCTVSNNGFTNRFVNVTSDVILDDVCWASCEACEVSVSEVATSTLVAFPNPVSGDAVNIRVSENMNGQAIVRIFDLRGALVYEQNAVTGNGNFVLNTAQLANGNYRLVIVGANEVASTNIMIQR
ncbi:MAG: T9SS type A sorting domain-containing protein [Flavobacteriales bacterium]